MINRSLTFAAALLLLLFVTVRFSPVVAQGNCQLFNEKNFTKLCPPFVNGIYYPTNLSIFNLLPADPPSLYSEIIKLSCKTCGSFMNWKLACGIMVTLYNAECSSQNSQVVNNTAQTVCRQSCLTQNSYCDGKNKTFTGAEYWNCGDTAPEGTSLYATCNGNAKDFSCCLAGGGANICHPPSFLNQDSGGVPNWVWIFIIGGGCLVLIIVGVGVFIFFRFNREDVLDLVNPCKWCECCPYYYDL